MLSLSQVEQHAMELGCNTVVVVGGAVLGEVVVVLRGVIPPRSSHRSFRTAISTLTHRKQILAVKVLGLRIRFGGRSASQVPPDSSPQTALHPSVTPSSGSQIITAASDDINKQQLLPSSFAAKAPYHPSSQLDWGIYIARSPGRMRAPSP